ncbi:aldehyde dehydrogenase family protein [Streptomyces sp. NBC_00038]|uniref:aldehyde dehydrogenase family protein n=1 Tax=Streptomyces sp. NBC_00038 TaxID=2903615 RepID=UPI0022507498|nr:aldehyde dehydrogenase family protein [Streptomyces sp. NBC_00038]MCX5562210.1 aldehyde dehydrogenase family protein [Streptomyces sp. NBC_00038]
MTLVVDKTRIDEVVGSLSHQLLINGEWVDAASGRTFETLNPASEEVLASVAHGEAEDVDLAVRAARAAFEEGAPWRRMPHGERGKIIHRLGDLVLEHLEDFALLESLDNGKPYWAAEAVDVPLAADLLHYMSGWATKIEGSTIPTSGLDPTQYLSFTLKEPVGVCAQIIPWNIPLLMAAWKIGPALAAGCTTVLKTAEQTPLSALLLGELAMRAGVPAGVLNIVTGFGDAGAALAAHPDVDKVTFTGSTEVGRKIVKAAAGSNLKKVSLELGGKSPNVIFADADIDKAITDSANAIFFNQGESCVAGSRLYVEESVYDEVVAGIAEQARSIKVGDGLDPGTAMGPLISQAQFERVTGYIRSGRDEGAVVHGGDRVGDRGYFVAPTVLAGTREDMTAVREEIFGPVVAVAPFSAESDIVPTANNTNYGLGAGVFTRDISKAYRTARRLRAGTVWVNTWNVFDASLPFGGYKESGWGREMGGAVFDNYLETKTVITDLG